MHRQTRSSRTLLIRAARAVLLPEFGPAFGTHFAEADPPTGGGAGDKKDDKKTDADKVTLTKAELKQQIEDALKAEREAAAETARKAKEAADAEALTAEAKKKGDYEALEKAANERTAAAERRAQLAEVNIELRDHLAKTHGDYLANAPDIMLHVQGKLAADAKTVDITKLIAEEAKAFVERTPREKKSGGLPGNKRSADTGGPNPPTKPAAVTARRFSTLQNRF